MMESIARVLINVHDQARRRWLPIKSANQLRVSPNNGCRTEGNLQQINHRGFDKKIAQN